MWRSAYPGADPSVVSRVVELQVRKLFISRLQAHIAFNIHRPWLMPGKIIQVKFQSLCKLHIEKKEGDVIQVRKLHCENGAGKFTCKSHMCHKLPPATDKPMTSLMANPATVQTKELCLHSKIEPLPTPILAFILWFGIITNQLVHYSMSIHRTKVRVGN